MGTEYSRQNGIRSCVKNPLALPDGDRNPFAGAEPGTTAGIDEYFF
nr:hypothetical protein [Cupriavidus taiwanensis]